MKTPILQLKDVTLIRNKRKILNKVSWTIRPGENWFMLGHNGSGKTSLLEIVLGYHWASEGIVNVLGERYGKTQIPELRRNIGYIAPWIQKHIRPQETVFEAVASGLKATAGFYDHVTAQVTKQVHYALDLVELREFEKAEFGKLSSGEQLKVLMARAIIHVPKLLILDEPFSALDFVSRLKLQKIVEKLGQRHPNLSIIIVTHHFDDITSLYTHGIVLKGGLIAVQGKKDKVLQSHALSKAFNLPLKVQKIGIRYTVQEKQ
jgi:iron complex transport system ATP-binding protein